MSLSQDKFDQRDSSEPTGLVLIVAFLGRFYKANCSLFSWGTLGKIKGILQLLTSKMII